MFFSTIKFYNKYKIFKERIKNNDTFNKVNNNQHKINIFFLSRELYNITTLLKIGFKIFCYFHKIFIYLI